jgi:hypothetical protein
MAYYNYAHYLMRKFQGNWQLAHNTMMASLILNLNKPVRFDSDMRILEELELLREG